MSGDATVPTDQRSPASSTPIGALVRLRDWVLIDGNRLFLATALSVGVCLWFLLLEAVGVVSFVNDDSVSRLAGGMVAGTFSLVTLVVSINQLILSREFSAVGEVRNRLEGVYDFREAVESHSGRPVSPGAPTGILERIVGQIRTATTTLEREADSLDLEEDTRADLERYVEVLDARTRRAEASLDRTSFGTFGAISVAVDYDVARYLYLGRRLERRHGSALSEEALDALESLIEAFELFVVAREHFKTTYLQRELTRFSQLTLLTGVPAIIAAMVLGFVYAGPTGTMLSMTVLPVVVSGLLAIVCAPLSLLTAYILRTATVTRRTASVGPMLPEKDPDSDALETLELPESTDE